MSRTDVHRPPWVQARDPYLRHEYRDEHDHSTGVCDLAVFLDAHVWIKTRCYRDYAGHRNPYCGCRLCTGHTGRKRANRKDRHAWRRDRHQILATGAGSLDVLTPRPRRTYCS